MEKLKLYTHEEMLDKTLGKKGTPVRNDYEAEINVFLQPSAEAELVRIMPRRELSEAKS